jgi:hypothetical protein
LAPSADRGNAKVLAVYGDFWSVKKDDIRAGDVIIVPEQVEDKNIKRFEVIMQTLYYTGTAIIAFIALGGKF